MRITVSRGISLKYFVGAAGLLVASSGAMATEIIGGTDGIVATDLPVNAVSMSLYGPDIIQEAEASFSFQAENGLSDGSYQYQVLGKVEESSGAPSPAYFNTGNGRGAGPQTRTTPVDIIEEGTFQIVDGDVLLINADLTEK